MSYSLNAVTIEGMPQDLRRCIVFHTSTTGQPQRPRIAKSKQTGDAEDRLCLNKNACKKILALVMEQAKKLVVLVNDWMLFTSFMQLAVLVKHSTYNENGQADEYNIDFSNNLRLPVYIHEQPQPWSKIVVDTCMHDHVQLHDQTTWYYIHSPHTSVTQHVCSTTCAHAASNGHTVPGIMSTITASIQQFLCFDIVHIVTSYIMTNIKVINNVDDVKLVVREHVFS